VEAKEETNEPDNLMKAYEDAFKESEIEKKLQSFHLLTAIFRLSLQNLKKIPRKKQGNWLISCSN